MKIKIALLSLLVAVAFIRNATGDNYNYAINLNLPLNYSQNAFNYHTENPNQPLLTEQQAKEKLADYKQRYFFPWSDKNPQTTFCILAKPDKNTCNDVKAIQQEDITYFQDKTEYDEDYLPYNIKDWLANMANQMDLNNFPNEPCNQHQCYGIIIKNSALRVFPTAEPFFANPQTPGEGYPFDYLQISAIWLGTPVQIVQHSVDKKWYLIKSQGILGWVPEKNVGRVSSEFINQWKNSNYTTLVQRRIIIEPNQYLYLGVIFPLVSSSEDSYHIQIPVLSPTRFGYTLVKTISISKQSARPWPLMTSPNNFNVVMNALIGMPYGWGGINFNSDCSETTRRVMSDFAIWLPRNSSWQGTFAGKEYSLANMSVTERRQWLIDQNGPAQLLPYLTLITFGHTATSVSHVGMYMGSFNIDGEQHAMMFNSAWGLGLLSTSNSSENTVGRAIIGKASIIPLNYGTEFLQSLLQNGLYLKTLWTTTGFNVTLLNESSMALQRLTQPLPLSAYVLS